MSTENGAEKSEFSAGGVVVRGDEVVVIVPTRRAANGSQVLALPKGHVDPGETALEAAVREVREETGIVAEVVCELGESRYWYRRDGRTVVVVAHGNSLRALCALIDDLDEHEVQDLNLPPGHPLVYDVAADGRATPRGGRYLDPPSARRAAEEIAGEGGT